MAADRKERFFVLWDGGDNSVEVLGYGPTEAAAWADAAHSFYCYHQNKPRFAGHDQRLGSRYLRAICTIENIFLQLATTP